MLLHATIGAVIAIRLAPGSGGPAACNKATQSYKAAKLEVNVAVQDYARCVTASRGRDSCAVEFDAVDAAHERFDAAVEDYRMTCGSGL